MEKSVIMNAIYAVNHALRSINPEDEDVRKVLNEKLIELVKQL